MAKPSMQNANSKPTAPAVEAKKPATNGTPMQSAPQAQPPATASTTPAQPEGKQPAYEQIARRAYEIYQARGGEHGHHQDDWSQAERELRLGKQ